MAELEAMEEAQVEAAKKASQDQLLREAELERMAGIGVRREDLTGE